MRIRLARRSDAQAIVEFNAAMALETEGKRLLPEVIGAGVRSLLRNPQAGFYVVAEERNQVIAALMITNEWSDWRNGTFWWIQSVYVRPEFRRKGVYKNLYRHIRNMAAKDKRVCGFRLYVERENLRAQKTYRALGMGKTHYLVYEELKPGVKFYR